MAKPKKMKPQKPAATKKKTVKATAKRTTPTAKRTVATTTERTVMPLSKVEPSKNPRTKSEVFTLLAETTGLSRKDVKNVFASLSDMCSKDMGKKGCGIFQVPGLMKIKRIHKPATKARTGINPFTGQEQTFKAKPARNIVKVRPLKALKEMV